MRTLSELIARYEEVQVIVDDEIEPFVEEVNRYGFKFYNGNDLTSENCGPRMSLYVFNKTVWYISRRIWHFQFANPKAVIAVFHVETDIKINYKAFVSGDAKYVYKTESELFLPDNVRN